MLLTGASVLLAFVLGRYLLPDPTSGFTGLPGGTVAAVKAWKGAGVSDEELAPRASMRRRIDRLQTRSDKVPTGVSQALGVGDPVEQHQRITDHLSKMDESNWRSVIDQFQFISHQTGRTHEDLWKLTMVRVGQVAGQEAMDDVAARGFDRERVFYGWAMTDPAAARAWMESTGQHDKKSAGLFLQHLVSGMAVADPDEAARYMAALPEDKWRSCAGDMVRNLVSGHGVEGASKWLEEILASDASPEMRRQVFNEVSQCVARTSKPDRTAPGYALDWFLRFGDSEFVNPGDIGQAAGRYEGAYAVDGLKFLQALGHLPAMQAAPENPPGLESVLRNALLHDPAAADHWLRENPSVAFHARAEQILSGLRQEQ